MCLFHTLGFLSEIQSYILHYLSATSASSEEENRMVKLESMREKKVQGRTMR